VHTSAALRLLYTDQILTTHADCSIRVSWFRQDNAQEPYRRVKGLALEAIKGLLNPDAKPHTINYQRERGKKEATRKWEEHWHENQCSSLAY
jgi:hypothetical protein